MTGRLSRAAAPALLCAAALTATACGGGSNSQSSPATSPAVPPTTAPSTTTPTAPPAPANPAAWQRIVPQPVSITPAGGVFPIDGHSAISTGPGTGVGQIGADLAAYLKQETGVTPPVSSGDGQNPAAGTLRVELEAAGADPAIGDEGYRLDVTPTTVTLRANTAGGLFHGVQTVRQLIAPGNGGGSGTGASIPAGQVADYPRYAYRGAMLDVARHFFSVGDVERYIDALSLYKINTLHLHLTDDQGWRIEIPGWPKLTSHGGSTEVGGGPGGFYTADDFKAVVAYAAAHYMAVIPESDMPGHVGAAVASYPALACDGRSHSLVTAIAPAYDSLCTGDESVYGYVDNVVGTLAGLAPGPYVGIGGDEASALNQTQYNGFIKRAQSIVSAHGKTALGWAEMAAGPLLPGTVVEYWNTAAAQPFVVDAAEKGTKVVMAPGNHAYLDQKYDPDTALGLHWAGYVPVSKSYDWDPVTILPGVPPTSVLGVEAPLWTETVHSLQDAETLAFPRLPAIAEIGWSTPESHSWTSFAARLAQQAPLWRTLGITYYRSPEIAWK